MLVIDEERIEYRTDLMLATASSQICQLGKHIEKICPNFFDIEFLTFNGHDKRLLFEYGRQSYRNACEA